MYLIPTEVNPEATMKGRERHDTERRGLKEERFSSHKFQTASNYRNGKAFGLPPSIRHSLPRESKMVLLYYFPISVSLNKNLNARRRPCSPSKNKQFF